MNYLLSEKSKFRIIRTVNGIKCNSCPLKSENKNELPCSLRITMDPKFSFIRVICGYCNFKSKIYYKTILGIDGILDEHAKVKKLE